MNRNHDTNAEKKNKNEKNDVDVLRAERKNIWDNNNTFNDIFLLSFRLPNATQPKTMTSK